MPEHRPIEAHLTVSVMCDRYVDVILGALDGADPGDCHLVVGDVGTMATGDAGQVLAWVVDVVAGVARSGAHAGASLTLSADGAQEPGSVCLEPTGQRARAYWWAGAPGGGHGVRAAERLGSVGSAELLDGDLSRVVALAADQWMHALAVDPTATGHLTLSLNSPSPLLQV